jgi:quaternary ammonium compound-resistance protein SugE
MAATGRAGRPYRRVAHPLRSDIGPQALVHFLVQFGPEAPDSRILRIFLLRAGALTENDFLAGGDRADATRRLTAGVATRSCPLYPSAGLGRPRSAEPRGSTESTLAWLWLATAGLFEIVWAIGLKYTDGFSRLWPSVVTLAAMALSMACLGVALKTLPVGTAYAVWVGIGALGTAVLGIVLFDESREPLRLLCLLLILAGVVGLKLVSREAS